MISRHKEGNSKFRKGIRCVWLQGKETRLTMWLEALLKMGLKTSPILRRNCKKTLESPSEMQSKALSTMSPWWLSKHSSNRGSKCPNKHETVWEIEEEQPNRTTTARVPATSLAKKRLLKPVPFLTRALPANSYLETDRKGLIDATKWRGTTSPQSSTRSCSASTRTKWVRT